MIESNKDISFLVQVRCITFNHASFITDAMDGFTMQDTAFPFVCTIIDDASTDGEPEVIRQYLQEHFDLEDKSIVRNEDTDDYVLTFAQHKSNKNCFFAVYLLKYNHYSIRRSKRRYLSEWSNTKYIALCEGDDYWIDRTKMQKQVSVLENNPQICMCSHAYKIVYSSKEQKGIARPMSHDGLLDTGLVIENKQVPQFATLLFRFSIQNRPSIFYGLRVGDYPLRVFAAISGGVYYMNDVMSCYRKSGEGSWTYKAKTNDSFFIDHLLKIIEFVKKLDQFTDGKYHRNVLNRIDNCQFHIYMRKGMYLKAFKTRYFIRMKVKDKIKMVLSLLKK